jgi:hypothetical protein
MAAECGPGILTSAVALERPVLALIWKDPGDPEVGTPLNRPVDRSRERPGGSDPLVMAQLGFGTPPMARKVKL